MPLGGAQVTLLDIDEERAHSVSEGRMPFLEWGADEALKRALASKRLTVSLDDALVRDHDVVVITIGTPIDKSLDPYVLSFDRFIDDVLGHMHDGQLLVLLVCLFSFVIPF